MVLHGDTRVMAFDGWTIPPGFKSDGCTFPGPLKYLRGIMKADDMKEACILHDFLRRHKIVSWIKADATLFCNLRFLGLDPIRSALYFIFVVISHPLNSGSSTMPPDWEKYRIKSR